MILLFIFFLFLFIALLKNRSVAVLLVFIQLLSVGGSFFLGRELKIDTLDDYGILLLTALLLFQIVFPWKDYRDVKRIFVENEKKIKLLTKVLIALSSISFIILLFTTILVQSSVSDINDYKYGEGVQQDFINRFFPFPLIFLSIAIIFSNFAHFLLPLHFYYLSVKKYKLSLVCFILSLNIVLLGMTYFSRAVVIHYVFLYIGMLFLLYGIFTDKIKRNIKIIGIFVGVLATLYFLDVSVRRFEEDADLARKYGKTIPVGAITQNPLVFSYLDYLSQGYLNGFEVMQLYRGEGFDGAITFEKLSIMMTSEYETYLRLKKRQRLWPYHYSYSFTGYPAYSLYDYGIFGSVILGFIYYFFVWRMRPKRQTLSMRNLFWIVLLIQIPLISIFYSEVGGLIIALILALFIWIFLKFNLK